MPIRSGEPAPYAPPAAVMQVVNGYRNRGLSTPFTNEVLVRAGVSESLAPRTLKTMEGLDLINEKGEPTPNFDALRRATSADFKARLAEHLQGVYAEVFSFTDPAVDDVERVADAFRSYEPIGQRARMVTLFLGLCEAAGIVTVATPARGALKPTTVVRAASKPKAKAPLKVAPVQRPDGGFVGAGGLPTSRGQAFNRDGHPIPSVLITALADYLPLGGAGWTQARRDQFLTMFGQMIDFTTPIVAEQAAAADDDEDDDDAE